MQNFTPKSKLSPIILGYMKSCRSTYERLGKAIGISRQAVGRIMRDRFPEEHMPVSYFITIIKELDIPDEKVLEMLGR